jgi:hypothetical protein
VAREVFVDRVVGVEAHTPAEPDQLGGSVVFRIEEARARRLHVVGKRRGRVLRLSRRRVDLDPRQLVEAPVRAAGTIHYARAIRTERHAVAVVVPDVAHAFAVGHAGAVGEAVREPLDDALADRPRGVVRAFEVEAFVHVDDRVGVRADDVIAEAGDHRVDLAVADRRACDLHGRHAESLTVVELCACCTALELERQLRRDREREAAR